MPTPSPFKLKARRLRAAFVLTAAFAALAALCLSQVPLTRGRAEARRATDNDRRATQRPRALESYGKLPMRFEANRGQSSDEVKFLARGAGYTLFLTEAGATLRLRQDAPKSEDAAKGKDETAARSASSYSTLRVKLEGSNRSPKLSGVEELEGRSNYLVGRDPRRWRTNVPAYAKVKYESVYPGVDMAYYGSEGRLEYDFLVAPGADATRVRLKFDGARSTRVDAGGELVINTGGGDVRQQRPLAYQEVEGARREVAARYAKDARGAVRIELGEYDRALPLVIDPVLVYSSYVGGAGFEQGAAIAVDSSGAAYVAGSTSQAASGPGGSTQGAGGGVDAYVVKLAPDGKSFAYVTYIGGDGDDAANAVAVDASGNAYAAGQTVSNNFPVTAGAFQTTKQAVSDGFVAKLNSAGTALTYATYFGGNGNDIIYEVAVNAAGAAYVAGRTDSASFNGFPSIKRAGSPALKTTDAGASWAASADGLTASRVNDFSVAASAPDTVYAATNLGVYKTTDNGADWQLTGQSSPSTAPAYTSNVAADPSNASIVYAASSDGGGVYKSTDGGATYAAKNTGLGDTFVNALAIDPSSPTTLYAGTFFGIYKTTNGGDSWALTDSGNFNQPSVNRIVIDPSNAQTLYAATNRGVLKSTNGGAAWAPVNNGLTNSGFTPSVRALAVAPSSTSTLYAYAAGADPGVYKTTDGGANWTKMSNGLSGASFLIGVNVLLVDPSSAAVVYAGTLGSGVYKTTDGGANWAASNNGFPNTNVLALASRAAAPAAVFAGVSVNGDAFAAKLNAAGSQFDYVRMFGGSDNDEVHGIGLTSDGSLYLSGVTTSADFPVVNAFQSSLGGTQDAFAAKLGPTGSTVYATYLGGSFPDQSNGLAVGADGSAYVTGTTFSTDFPLANALQPARGDTLPLGEVFVTKLAPDGKSLTYSTYLGGNGEDRGLGVAVASDGTAYVTGATNSTDFPTLVPSNVMRKLDDAFLTEINPAGTAILFSTYFGGASNDQCNSIALDSSGGIYVVGTTNSLDLPMLSSADSTPGGKNDGFVAKFGLDADLSLTNVESRDPVMVGNSLTYTLTVSNAGVDAAQNVVVTDALPAGPTFVSSTASQGTCAGTSTVTCNLGNINAGASATVNITVTPQAAGNITNNASVTATTPDHDTSNNSASQQTRVSTLPSIAGHVATPAGAGVNGVAVSLNGSQTSNTTTAADGFYEFGDLASGGNYTVTPSHPSYVFHPQSRSVPNLTTDATADFTAVQCVFQLSARNASFNAAGGSGSLTVTAADDLCAWTAASDVPWIQITSGAQGTGTNRVSFTVAPTTLSRSGTIHIAGQVFTVWQAVTPCDTPSFNVAPRLDAVRPPYRLKRADFNNDGRADLVVLHTVPAQVGNGTVSAVSVVLGNGSGGFGAPHTVLLPASGREAAVGDFNKDGRADVAVAMFGQSSNVAILLGDGAGNLGTPSILTAGGLPTSVAVGDFNNDTKQDLAVSNEDSHNVSVFLGDGAGGFTKTENVGGISGVILHAAQRVVVSDLNKDGKQDLVIGGSFIWTAKGKGDGTFETPVQYNSNLGSIVVADFNKDGKDDVVGWNGNFGVSIMKGDGAGGLGSPVAIPTGGRQPGRLIVADFNKDGNLDLGAANSAFQGSLDVNVLLGDGAGSFTPGPAYVTGVGVLDIADGDFNGDGLLDLAAADSNVLSAQGSLTMLFGKGDGEFAGARSFVTAFEPTGFVTDDFNGDGRADLVVTNGNANFGGAYLMKGDGAGGFGPATLITSMAGTQELYHGDFNGDGKADFAVLGAGGNGKSRVVLFLGDGAGGFTQASDTALDAFAYSVVLRDFNGDGRADLVNVNALNAVTIRLGDGAGGFGAPSVLNGTITPARLEAGDFNGDGRLDVAAVPASNLGSCDAVNISLFFGDGSGGFSAPSATSFGGEPLASLVYDFNGDGRSDLAVLNACNKKLGVLLANASGGFASAGEFDTGDVEPRRLALADFNGDGKPDLVVSNGDSTSTANTLGVLTGDGAGGFSAPSTFLVGRDGADLAVADFDGNGRADIATTNFTANTVAVLLNACPVALSTSTVQFGASVYNAPESAGAVTINVTRTGDTTAAASVRYSTQPGTASPRTDYTTAVGTLRFNAGETEKSFQVLLTDDALAEGDESLTLTLSDPVGAGLGTPHAVPLNIVENDAAPSSSNPIDDSTFFVRQHYHDFLNREPDAPGLAFWVNEIEKCGADIQCREVRRINVSAAFFLSIEFQEEGYLVERFYKTAYGDATSPNVAGTVPVIRLEDFLPDTQQIGAGVQVGIGDWQNQLEANKQAYALEFVQRRRFTDAFPSSLTPAQFVDKLNTNAGGVLSQAERDQLVNALTSDNTTHGRASVVRQVAENGTLRRRELNRAFVLMQYYGYLRRNPDDPQDTDFRGWKFWLDKLNQFNGNFVQAEMVKAFISSDEYRHRFGQ